MDTRCLTIVVPSFNHGAYIEQCLVAASAVESAREIVMIDDGSTDDTVARARSAVQRHALARVRIVEKRNAGLVSSLNLGLSLADGELIYFVASDDWPVAAGVDTLATRMAADPECALVIGGGRNHFEDGHPETPIYRRAHQRYFDLPVAAFRSACFTAYPHPILLQSTVFRVAALRRVGGWDPTVTLDDFPLFVRLFLTLDRRHIDFRPDIDVVRYRHHSANVHRDSVRQYRMVRQAIERLAPAEMIERSLAGCMANYLLQAMVRGRWEEARAIWSSRADGAWQHLPTALVEAATRRLAGRVWHP
jgi:glycosyltransferase involved in cell wall biosynthesis